MPTMPNIEGGPHSPATSVESSRGSLQTSSVKPTPTWLGASDGEGSSVHDAPPLVLRIGVLSTETASRVIGSVADAIGLNTVSSSSVLGPMPAHVLPLSLVENAVKLVSAKTVSGAARLVDSSVMTWPRKRLIIGCHVDPPSALPNRPEDAVMNILALSWGWN